MKKVRFLGVWLGVWLFLAAPAMADYKTDPDNFPWKKGYVNLGYFFSELNSAFRIGSSTFGLGLQLDVEEFLDMDTNESTFRLDAGWRWGKTRRHKVEFSWFSFDRTGERNVGSEIELPPELGGGKFGPGIINSVFNFDIIKTKYEYSFVLNDNADLNVGIGLYIMPMELGLTGAVTGIGSEELREEITAPLPVIGLGFDYAVTPKWFIRQQADVFYLEIGGYSGGVMSYSFGLEYLPWKYFGFGLGVDALRVEVEADGDTSIPGVDFRGNVEFNYFGAQIYVKAFY